MNCDQPISPSPLGIIGVCGTGKELCLALAHSMVDPGPAVRNFLQQRAPFVPAARIRRLVFFLPLGRAPRPLVHHDPDQIGDPRQLLRRVGGHRSRRLLWLGVPVRRGRRRRWRLCQHGARFVEAFLVRLDRLRELFVFLLSLA